MRRGETINSRARPGLWTALAAARALARAVVAAVAGLAVCLAAATVPAVAAQHPGGPAASHSRRAAGQHADAGRMNHRARWAHLAAGASHTCGIRTGGTLWCWGYNYSGQLGIGSHGIDAEQDRPRQVTGCATREYSHDPPAPPALSPARPPRPHPANAGPDPSTEPRESRVKA